MRPRIAYGRSAYGLAVAATAVAVLIRWLLDPTLSDLQPLATAYAAVAFAAWAGGYRPALLAAILGYVACDYLFMEPRGSFTVGEIRNLIELPVYIVSCAIIVGFGEALRVSWRRLAEQRERLQTTLASIGDAVLTTDRDGRMTYLNAVAEALTGWKNAEALGQPLDTVFRIVDEQTRLPIQNPVQRVLQEGRIVGLGNHTILIAKDGTERPIDDSAAPIRSEDGEIAGCVLVCRDVTEVNHLRAAMYNEREFLRITLASIGDAVLTTDTAGRITFMNAVAETLTGWRRADASGQPLTAVFRIVNEQTRRTVEDPATRALREGLIVGLANHTVLIAKDGTERAVDDSAAPIKDGQGRIVGCVLVFRDVTARRQAEHAARFLAAIVESCDDAIIGKNVDGIITSWNRAAERLFGYSAAEAIGQPIDLLAPDDRADEMSVILDRIRRGERIDHFDTARRTKDGQVVPISLTVSPIRDDEGRIVGASKICTDISARKRAEEALREEKARLHATLTGIGDAVIVTDRDGHVTLMNGVAHALTGWTGDAAGRHLEDVFRIINEQTRRPVDSPVTRVIREGVVVGLANHTILIGRDGTEHPIDDSAAPIHDAQGRVVGCVLVFRDVTERRQSEKRIYDLMIELRGADRRKDEFLATLAHELRGPLAPLRHALEIVKRAGDDATVVQTAHETMERQLGHLVRLVDDLLDVSRITRDKLELRMDSVELASVVHQSMAACRPLIEAAQHAVHVNLPAAPIYLHADPVRLTQVFTNLLNNACKYTEPGGTIWLSATRDGGDVVVTVKDTGVGIPNDKLASVFEMFSQAPHSAWERSQGGLGIGLTLVKRLVEMHGGTVSVRSGGPGKGSEFTVRLLRAPAPATRPGPHARPAAPAVSRRVLVVDDNRDSAESLALLLKMSGHQTAMAYDGVEALEAAERFSPELVLLDIGLPKLSGHETARRIRAQPWGKGMTLVALTGWGQEEDRRKAKDAGFDHHLVKPVDYTALMNLFVALGTGPRQPANET